MEFHGTLGGPEAGPWEGVQAQVDGRGVERVDSVVEFQAEILVVIQGAGDANQGLAEVLPNPPVAQLVGIRQRRTGDAAADAHVVKLAALAAQGDLEIAQAATAGDLGKRHAEELVQTGEGAYTTVAAVALHTAMEGV